MPDTVAQRPSPSDSRVVPPTRISRYSGAGVPAEDRYVSTVGLLATLVVMLTIATVVANRDSAFPPPQAPPTRVDSPARATSIPRDKNEAFARLDSLAHDSATAASAVTGLDSLTLASDEDRVRAALVRFTAALSLGDKNACDALKEVRTIAPRTTKATLVAGKLTDLCSN